MHQILNQYQVSTAMFQCACCTMSGTDIAHGVHSHSTGFKRAAASELRVSWPNWRRLSYAGKSGTTHSTCNISY